MNIELVQLIGKLEGLLLHYDSSILEPISKRIKEILRDDFVCVGEDHYIRPSTVAHIKRDDDRRCIVTVVGGEKIVINESIHEVKRKLGI